MIVAGWADGYRNNTLRTFEQLRCPNRLLIGPWATRRPTRRSRGRTSTSCPSMIRWWDRWLKGEDNGIDREPPIVLFAQRSTRPGPTRRRCAASGGTSLRGRPSGCGSRWRSPMPTRTRGRRRGDVLDVRGDVGWTAWISCAGHLPWGQPTTSARTRRSRSLHVAAARAGPGDPGARAAHGDPHVVGTDRLPLREALRRVPRRRVVARVAQHAEPRPPGLRARIRRRSNPARDTRSRSTWRRRRGRSRRGTGSGWTWPARTGRTRGPRRSR